MKEDPDRDVKIYDRQSGSGKESARLKQYAGRTREIQDQDRESMKPGSKQSGELSYDLDEEDLALLNMDEDMELNNEDSEWYDDEFREEADNGRG